MKAAFIILGTENLGIEYLSGALRKEGHQTKQIFEPGLFSESNDALRNIFSQKKRIIEEIKIFKPELIGFSVVTSTYQWACAMAKEIKAAINIPIIFGGYHASAAPEQVISNDFVDMVCIGEGEEAICELAKNIDRGELSGNIRNIWFKDRGAVIRNPLRPLQQELDQIPFPDKSIYQDVPLIYSKYMIITSRGCPFNCNFCGNYFLHHLYPSAGKAAIRRRSVENILAELKAGKLKYRYKKVLFFDDAFGYDRAWLKEFLKKYKTEINTPFYCYQHVLYLDEEMICLLKAAGCFLIQIGVESAVEANRKNILNRSETNAQVEKIIKACRKTGLKVQVDHMFGLPMEGEKEQQIAAEFYNRTRPDSISCFWLTYYPGTKMIELAKEKGWLTQEEINSANQGETADYGNHRRSDVIKARHKGTDLMYKNFLVLFKLLPLLPPAVVRYIVRKRGYRFFHLAPHGVIDLLKIINMLIKHDHLLFAHYQYYLYQTIRRCFKRS
jgi:anaerobic magnesium-protoporphyrin IX monomethyl ester cyclase